MKGKLLLELCLVVFLLFALSATYVSANTIVWINEGDEPDRQVSSCSDASPTSLSDPSCLGKFEYDGFSSTACYITEPTDGNFKCESGSGLIAESPMQAYYTVNPNLQCPYAGCHQTTASGLPYDTGFTYNGVGDVCNYAGSDLGWDGGNTGTSAMCETTDYPWTEFSYGGTWSFIDWDCTTSDCVHYAQYCDENGEYCYAILPGQGSGFALTQEECDALPNGCTVKQDGNSFPISYGQVPAAVCGDGLVVAPEECEPIIPGFNDLACKADCTFNDIGFNMNQCISYGFPYLRDYCGEPIDGGDPEGGLDDTPLIAADPNVCDRGVVACGEPHANLTHDGQTTPFEITKSQTATFNVKLNATAPLVGATPADIMFVLDRSGSMNDPDTQGPAIPKIQKATSALNYVYGLLRAHDQTYPDDNIFQVGLQSFNHDDQINYFPQYIEAAPAIAQPQACGCTGIGEAFSDTITKTFDPITGIGSNGLPFMCQDGNTVQKVMIIASDGMENRERFLQEVLADGEIPDDITFYTIGIAADGVWADQLNEIATKWGTGNGFYTGIPSFDQLQDVYEDIAEIYTGTQAAERATMSITLIDEFSFVGDDSGFPRTVDGQTITWQVPAMNVGQIFDFNIEVEPKAATNAGDYQILIQPDSKVALHNGCYDNLEFGDVNIRIVDGNNDPTCGNGRIDPNEECDDGNTLDGDFCSSTCKLAICEAPCGNGLPDAGEACDDGNNDNEDGCTNACEINICTDGILNRGVEECDDGNLDDTDACTNSCKNAFCGDGSVWAANGEVCDDGNDNDLDSCTACQPNICGDGILNVGVEACDPGAALLRFAPDFCRPGCIAPTCGDRLIDIGEVCDDGPLGSDTCYGNDVDPLLQCTVKPEDPIDPPVVACLDNVWQFWAGEACDPTAPEFVGTQECAGDCTRTKCGDNIIQTPNGFNQIEECDAGPFGNATCTPTCKLACQGTEVCDGWDNDCDGLIDEGLVCAPLTCGDDCDDTNPLLTTYCGGIDPNCGELDITHPSVFTDLLGLYRFNGNLNNEDGSMADLTGLAQYTAGRSTDAYTLNQAYDGIQSIGTLDHAGGALGSNKHFTISALFRHEGLVLDSNDPYRLIAGEASWNPNTNTLSSGTQVGIMLCNDLVHDLIPCAVVTADGFPPLIITAPMQVPANEWMHLAVRVTPTTVDLVVNGQVVAGNALPSAAAVSTKNFAIGKLPLTTSGDIKFEGQLDEVAVWSRALSNAELFNLWDRLTSEICEPTSTGGSIYVYDIKCMDNELEEWQECADIAYLDTLTAVQVECRSDYDVTNWPGQIDGDVLYEDPRSGNATYYSLPRTSASLRNAIYELPGMKHTVGSGVWNVNAVCEAILGRSTGPPEDPPEEPPEEPEEDPLPMPMPVFCEEQVPLDAKDYVVPLGSYFFLDGQNKIDEACCSIGMAEQVTSMSSIVNDFDTYLLENNVQDYTAEQLQELVACQLVDPGQCTQPGQSVVFGVTLAGDVTSPFEENPEQVLCCAPSMALSVNVQACLGDLEPIGYLDNPAGGSLATTPVSNSYAVCAAPLNANEDLACQAKEIIGAATSCDAGSYCVYKETNGNVVDCSASLNAGSMMCCSR